jgi:hypothetical protein
MEADDEDEPDINERQQRQTPPSQAGSPPPSEITSNLKDLLKGNF